MPVLQMLAAAHTLPPQPALAHLMAAASFWSVPSMLRSHACRPTTSASSRSRALCDAAACARASSASRIAWAAGATVQYASVELLLA